MPAFCRQSWIHYDWFYRPQKKTRDSLNLVVVSDHLKHILVKLDPSAIFGVTNRTSLKRAPSRKEPNLYQQVFRKDDLRLLSAMKCHDKLKKRCKPFPPKETQLQTKTTWPEVVTMCPGSNHLVSRWLGCPITSSNKYLGTITILRSWLDPLGIGTAWNHGISKLP